MRRMAFALCGLILGAGAALGAAQPVLAQAALQGSWTATKAERDGKPAAEVVGNRLTVSGNRFEIASKDGRTLYAGTLRLDPKARPAVMDFDHSHGALKGRAWLGIYELKGDTLVVCDNAPDLAKGRPAAFAAKPGSGFVLITFARAK